MAAAVQSLNATGGHRVVQVEEYPTLGTPECIPAPFTGRAYLSALGITISPLQASIDARGRPKLATSDGVPVIALKAGAYAIAVTDNNSRKAGLKLSGFFVSRHTSAAFRGTVTWTVNLAGANLTYRVTGAPRTQRISFTVLP